MPRKKPTTPPSRSLQTVTSEPPPTLRAQAEALVENYLAGLCTFTGLLTGQEDRIDALLEAAFAFLAPETNARLDRFLAQLPDDATREEVTSITAAYVMAGAEVGFQAAMVTAGVLDAHGLPLPTARTAPAVRR